MGISEPDGVLPLLEAERCPGAWFWPTGGGAPQILERVFLAAWEDRALLADGDAVEVWRLDEQGAERVRGREGLDVHAATLAGGLLWLTTRNSTLVADAGLDELVSTGLPKGVRGTPWRASDGRFGLEYGGGVAVLDAEGRLIELREGKATVLSHDLAWTARRVDDLLLIRSWDGELSRLIEGIGRGDVGFSDGLLVVEGGARAFAPPDWREVEPDESTASGQAPEPLFFGGPRAWAMLAPDGTLEGEDPGGALMRAGDGSLVTALGGRPVAHPRDARALIIVPLQVEPRACQTAGHHAWSLLCLLPLVARRRW